MYNDETKGINFDLPKNQSNVIKVIGVGGGKCIKLYVSAGYKGCRFCYN